MVSINQQNTEYMDLKWQDGAIPGKKLKKPSRTPEEVSQAKKQYEQKRSQSFKLHWTTDHPWLRYDEHEQMMFSGKNIFGLVCTDSV
jgi:aspartyl-tRNA synthetase